MRYVNVIKLNLSKQTETPCVRLNFQKYFIYHCVLLKIHEFKFQFLVLRLLGRESPENEVNVKRCR